MADLLEVMDIWEHSAARKAAGVPEKEVSEETYRLISTEKEKIVSFSFLTNTSMICGIKG